MHKNVAEFVKAVKWHRPNYFNSGRVLECGSLDINGSNKPFFEGCEYTGIDIVDGKNVNIVTRVHEFIPKISSFYDVVISTEMLEHDKYYAESLEAMFRLLKIGGLLIVTAAGEGREEHGTRNRLPKDSPLTNDYYANVTVDMLQKGLNFSKFSWFTVNYQLEFGDIQFAGIKK